MPAQAGGGVLQVDVLVRLGGQLQALGDPGEGGGGGDRPAVGEAPEPVDGDLLEAGVLTGLPAEVDDRGGPLADAPSAVSLRCTPRGGTR